LTQLILSGQRLYRDPIAIAGIFIILFVGLVVLAGPFLTSHNPVETNMSDRLLKPSSQYLLGTDHLGRDIFSRLIYGAQITLGIAGLVVAVILLIGVPVGLLSGYVGGRVDAILMRVVDGLIAFPEFILAIAIAGFLGPSLTNVMMAIVLVKWVGYARLVRGIVLSEKEKEYVLAARVGGCGPMTILVRHLLPQVYAPVLVLATLDIGKVILAISSLSFLGLGAQPPLPEWGAMLNDGRPYFQTHPSLMFLPGGAIMLVVLGCNLLGDGLRDVLDPKGV
jgi:peptide/nickel transport system permease protein